MSCLRKIRWPWIILSLLILLIATHSYRLAFSGQEKGLRTYLRDLVRQQAPDSFEKAQKGYGIHPFLAPATAKGARENGRHVILVHGLDDPGLIWQNLAPALVEKGYQVWLMDYPNDQPVRDSAFFFAAQLERFISEQGMIEVAIVSHSMGGLVTREMLTNPKIGYRQKSKEKKIPVLSHFIMVAVPNHGSIFSRLRFLAEIRDQFVNIGKEEYHWLRFITDGAGEAGIDLYPKSDFLLELNSRPIPTVARMLTIAGIMSPWEKRTITQGLEKAMESLPKSVRSVSAKLPPILGEIIDKVGDGLVSVESVRLPGVPLIQVRGNHLTIIRNLTKNSKRVPPAIPLIFSELEVRKNAHVGTGQGTHNE